MGMSLWDIWVDEALSKLESLKVIRSLRPIHLRNKNVSSSKSQEFEPNNDEHQVFDGLRQWDRDSVHVDIAESTFKKWVQDIPSSGDDQVSRETEANGEAGAHPQKFRKLLIFSGNDYLGLSSHPSVGKASAKAAEEHGMGPRGSALICGYTNYHRRLESCLAELKKKEVLD